MKILDKDWDRMSDLILSGKEGIRVAKLLKNKDKAIARFVSGLKLENTTSKYNPHWKEYRGSFSEFGNRALELGATNQEIQMVFDENEVPSKYSIKLKALASKKLDNRFVGDLSRKILDAGYDIEFCPCNGFALTMLGKEAMEKNGRKWTIGYKTHITVGERIVKLAFDAITDEGDGPTTYVLDKIKSEDIFATLSGWEKYTKTKFQTVIMDVLKKS